MKNLFRQWNSINIIYRILGGLLLGIILALVFPDASAISLLGTIFVNALKGIAPLLVFFLVISSLCHAGQSHGGIICSAPCSPLSLRLLQAFYSR